MKNILTITLLFAFFWGCTGLQKQREKETLKAAFRNPPDSTRAWVYWFWINGNVTKEGITADLEAMKRVGVGGVLWMGVSGPWWAPRGPVEPYTEKWHNLMQWSLQEATRLGLKFDITVDYGYGSGGPHINLNNSMHEVYWSDTVIDGGKTITLQLNKPHVSKENASQAWLRPGEKLNDKVLNEINNKDSYRDIAVRAVPWSSGESSYQMPLHKLRVGLNAGTYFKRLEAMAPPAGAVAPRERIVDLTGMMKPDGTLSWEAPEGKWQIIRMGHASNYKMTRPCPPAAVGLECDRLSPEGINAHFEAFLRPIFEDAGSMTGKTLQYVHVDSWEADYQNWTSELPAEFRERRGYNIESWLPVLSGKVVESPQMSDRFLWDFRQTLSEMVLNNYHGRLKELARPYGIQFSTEAYGRLCVDQVRYAETGDFPVCEFWTSGRGKYPQLGGYQFQTTKVMSSAAHTLGKPRVGAEAFTTPRGMRDHPYLLKGIGDKAFCNGVNHFILHLFAHQAYDRMKPGLTHRKWGHHFDRHNTWWEYSNPWFDYLARSQYMLRQGTFVADVCYFFGEGAPINQHNMKFELPAGYDYDFCSSHVLRQMEMRDGMLVLPSGMKYRYLLLPGHYRLTLPAAQKVKELVESGAQVVAQQRVNGTPGLSGYPQADREVRKIAGELWKEGGVISEENWSTIFQDAGLPPDFEGEGLNYIHRKDGDMDIYFVANPDPKRIERRCSFRVSGKVPELWNPETGETRQLPVYESSEDRITVPLQFGPMQSWFIVFSDTKPSESGNEKNFPQYAALKNIDSPWRVRFDPDWGGPQDPVTFDTLIDWSKHKNKGIRYYSGTATYSNTFNLSAAKLPKQAPVYLYLGDVEVMARVRVNGKDCGTLWKPPYRTNISKAIQEGQNKLEIEVVNLWINRMIGDERMFPEDCEWINNKETLKEWTEWFLKDDVERPTGRYTFVASKHYSKDGPIYYEDEDPLYSSGLMGPVKIYNSTYTY